MYIFVLATCFDARTRGHVNDVPPINEKSKTCHMACHRAGLVVERGCGRGSIHSAWPPHKGYHMFWVDSRLNAEGTKVKEPTEGADGQERVWMWKNSKDYEHVTATALSEDRRTSRCRISIESGTKAAPTRKQGQPLSIYNFRSEYCLGELTWVPAPTAMPTSAMARAGESLTPSPTIATACPILCNS